MVCGLPNSRNPRWAREDYCVAKGSVVKAYSGKKAASEWYRKKRGADVSKIGTTSI